MSTRWRWIFTLASFTLVVGASWYVAKTTFPRHEAMAHLPKIVHVLAIIAVLLEILARAGKIQLIGYALRIPFSFGTSVRACLGGDLGGSLTPLRTGAEPARFLVLAEGGVPPAKRVLVLWTELMLEMLSLAFIAVVCLIAFRGSGAAISGLIIVVTVYAGFLFGGASLGMLLSRRHAWGKPPRWARRFGLHAGRWRVVQRSLRQMRKSQEALKAAKPWPLVISLLVSIVHVALRLVALPIIVLWIAPETPVAPLIVWPLVLLYGGVAAPLPGGGGLIEVAFGRALTDTIPPDLFGASLIWWRVYTFYIYILLGGIAAGRTALRAMRAEGEAELEADLVTVDREIERDERREEVETAFGAPANGNPPDENAP